ncbi:MAG: hypothetical protein GF347_02310 [Candidatus Moranbacteria bacterium]|nr:hypothetical protein [Candidatus Moranbacteria bacterium]
MQENPNQKTISEKKYAVSICLAGVFGILGIHHFYLGKWLMGLFDLSLSIAAFYCLYTNHPLLGFLFLFIDILHSIIVISLLIVGKLKDGKGHLISYPGQKIQNQ